MTTFVSVGNAHQSFGRLINAVVAIADRLPQPVVIQHGHSPCASSKVQAVSFMDMDEFEMMMVQASLLILHGGCGVLINAIQNGRIPVVMARRKHFGEMVDDHQVEFSEALAAENKIAFAETPQDLWPAVKRAMDSTDSDRVDLSQRRSFMLIGATLRKYHKAIGTHRKRK